MKTYYVYIIGNARPTLYIGVTNNLSRRFHEHLNELNDGFSKNYHLHRLLYFEETASIEDAIKREKQLKAWKREWKLELIRTINPHLEDLSEEILNRVQDDVKVLGLTAAESSSG